ncbi:MAG TPA: hypothetical protein VK842_04870 [bacterium]|nr:hypothetical protein [bacterium]
MNKLVAAALAAALICIAIPAFAEDEVVTVTFASIVATPAKDGSTLDPKLFSFGSNKAGADEDRSRVSGSTHGRSKEDACRWAMLSSFLKFQHKAQSMGKHVTEVRTNIGDQKSDKADACLCLVGRWAVKSQIIAVYK